MAKLVFGKRIAKEAVIRPSAAAVIFDETGEKVLITQRTDNSRWCLPGGGMDSGESVEEACVREVMEETGLEVQVSRLIGIYSSPDSMIIYADGNKIQGFTAVFEAKITGGKLGLSNETLDAGFYSLDDMKEIDLMENSWQRIEDALARVDKAFYR
jgi:8-oxo-dGTP pyrophosphatase MutT (NUDIX family)